MILGIMQPYFFPYLEHFRLLADCDRWIVFDTVAFRRKTWMSRNRILNRDKGWSYVSVPIAGGAHRSPVAEARIATPNWASAFRDSVAVYAHETPYYDETCELLSEILGHEHETLTDLNTCALRTVARHLGIGTPIERLSEMDLDLPREAGAADWAPLISAAVGATEYRNPSGGRELFDPQTFDRSGVLLSFHEHRPIRYPTGTFDFVADLSVIDPLMWCGSSAVARWVAGRATTAAEWDPHRSGRSDGAAPPLEPIRQAREPKQSIEPHLSRR